MTEARRVTPGFDWQPTFGWISRLGRLCHPVKNWPSHNGSLSGFRIHTSPSVFSTHRRLEYITDTSWKLTQLTAAGGVAGDRPTTDLAMRIRRCDSERSTAVTGLAVLWVPLVLLVLPAVTNGASVQAVSSLRLFDQVLITTAEQEFAGHDKAFTTAINWHRERLAREGRAAPHLICAEYGKGRQSSLELERFLGNSESFRRVSNSRAQGTCFMVTASSAQAAALSEHPTEYGLSLVGPLPSVLKIAPGLLDHEASPMPPSTSGQERSARLATTHGRKMSLDNVGGLSVALSPGTLSAARRDSAKISGRLIEALHQSLMSDAVDLHAANFWSDRGMLEGHRKGSAEGALRAREWTRAAQVVHELCGETAVKEGPTPGDICSWDSIIFHHAGGDTLMVTGLCLPAAVQKVQHRWLQ